MKIRAAAVSRRNSCMHLAGEGISLRQELWRGTAVPMPCAMWWNRMVSACLARNRLVSGPIRTGRGTTWLPYVKKPEKNWSLSLWMPSSRCILILKIPLKIVFKMKVSRRNKLPHSMKPCTGGCMNFTAMNWVSSCCLVVRAVQTPIAVVNSEICVFFEAISWLVPKGRTYLCFIKKLRMSLWRIKSS